MNKHVRPQSAGRGRSHFGKPRKMVNPARANQKIVPKADPQIKSPISNPLVRKQLQLMVLKCEHRKVTDKVTTAPCCASEGGKVYHCTLYNLEPAKPYDCMICQRDKAIREGQKWISTLLKLAQGQRPEGSLSDIVHQLKDSSS